MKVLDFIDKIIPHSRSWGKGNLYGAIVKSSIRDNFHKRRYITFYVSQYIFICSLWFMIFVGKDPYRDCPIVGVDVDGKSFLSWIIVKISLLKRFYIQVGIGKK